MTTGCKPLRSPGLPPPAPVPCPLTHPPAPAHCPLPTPLPPTKFSRTRTTDVNTYDCNFRLCIVSNYIRVITIMNMYFF